MPRLWRLNLGACLIATSVLATPVLATPALATDVKVHVTGIDNRGGDLRIQICTRETFLKECPYRQKLTAIGPTMDVVIQGVPPGAYAVIAHHDINRNGRVDQTLLGVPEEGVGFSRNPMLILRAPTFDETSLPVAGALVEVDIGLKFEP